MDTTINASSHALGAEPFGTMPGPASVTIERILPGPVERVWAYITESDKRRKWLAAGPMDLRQGGAVALTFRNDDLAGQAPRPVADLSPDGIDHQLSGVIIRCEPPRLLVFTWSPGAAASEVTFELSPVGSDTQLVVTHRRLPNHGQLLSVSAGWHTHIGVLKDILSQEEPRSFEQEYAKLAKIYGERFAE